MKTSLVIALLTLASAQAIAGPIDQWASGVIGFSSEWGTWYTGRPSIRYAASQALGEPNVFVYAENWRSWAAYPMDGSLEWIALSFAIPVFADGVMIRETLGNGFVYEVAALDKVNQWHIVWSGTDPSPRGEPVNFLASFDKTPYLVTGVRIRINTNSKMGVWEEIDAVQLHGNVPEAGSAILLALGVLCLAGYGLRRQSTYPKA